MLLENVAWALQGDSVSFLMVIVGDCFCLWVRQHLAWTLQVKALTPYQLAHCVYHMIAECRLIGPAVGSQSQCCL